MANTSDHTTVQQIAFLESLNIYRSAGHPRPVSTANKDIDWSTVVAAEAIGDIYTGLAVTPSPAGDRMVRLNGRVDIDGQALQLISDDQRNALIYALENPDAADSADVLRALGTSPQLRLRYPEDAATGQAFAAEQIESLDALHDKDALQTVFTDLLDTASDADKFRLYDLANGYGGKTNGDPTRNARSMEFALRMNPTSLPELVCFFEFYNASCEVAALTSARQEIRDRREAGEVISRGNGEKAIRKQNRQTVALQDSTRDGTLADGVVESVANALETYKAAVTDLGFGTGPIACPYVEGDFAANCTAIKARHAALQFGDLASAAYHTLKHCGELRPAAMVETADRTPVQNQVFSYYTAARDEVDVTATSIVQIGQSGGEKHIFKTNNMRAITWLSGGQAGLATYTS